MSTELLSFYYDACNALLQAFCEKHDFDYKDARQGWVADETGGTACCGDFCFSMDEIVTDLRENAPEEELLKWYDYTMECAHLGINGCRYKSWLHGCPTLSEEQLEELRKAKRRVEEAQEMLNKCVKRYKNNGY